MQRLTFSAFRTLPAIVVLLAVAPSTSYTQSAVMTISLDAFTGSRDGVTIDYTSGTATVTLPLGIYT